MAWRHYLFQAPRKEGRLTHVILSRQPPLCCLAQPCIHVTLLIHLPDHFIAHGMSMILVPGYQNSPGPSEQSFTSIVTKSHTRDPLQYAKISVWQRRNQLVATKPGLSCSYKIVCTLANLFTHLAWTFVMFGPGYRIIKSLSKEMLQYPTHSSYSPMVPQTPDWMAWGHLFQAPRK